MNIQIRSVLAGLVIALGSLPASAQSGSGPAASNSDTLALRFGATVVTAPKFEGSKEYRVFGIPLLLPVQGDEPGRVQFRSIDDIRFRLFDWNNFEFGPSAGYRFGRDEEDSRRLRGLGDVDGGVALGAYGAFRFGLLRASLGYSHQVSGDDAGGQLRADLDARHRLTDRVLLRAGIGTTWADEDFMQSRFGVTALQSGRSGLARFEPDAGIKDVNIMLGATIDLDPRWQLGIQGRYAHLVGDAADSPIVETEHQFSANLSLTYRFEMDNPFARATWR